MYRAFLILFLFATSLIGETVFADPEPSIMEPRQIIVPIKSADSVEINHVLSSMNNVLKYYGPENVKMRIVAYYHGIDAVLKKHKEIALRVKALMLLDVEFYACQNTMDTKKISKDELIEGTEVVTAGIVEIAERVKEGWIYIVP
jgi:intracellular sulfur oxidation DsrE/DsrF family protein